MNQSNKVFWVLVMLLISSTASFAEGAGNETLKQGPLYGKDGFYLGCVVVSQDEDDSVDSFELDDTVNETSCIELGQH